MAVDPRKRQKKQERRAAKRKEKRYDLQRAQLMAVPQRLAAAARYPILRCWVSSTLEDSGIGWACLSRQLPNGTIAHALFLIDRYCMGVKNVVADVTSRYDFETRIEWRTQRQGPVQELAPAGLRYLLEAAVAYAEALGIKPHPLFEKVLPIFGDIAPERGNETWEFGKDGKPFFMAGPNDDPVRCQKILSSLHDRCGPGGYHFLMPVSPTKLEEYQIVEDEPEAGEPAALE